MDNWLVYTFLTVIYIIILAAYFWRRSRNYEKELKEFLAVAKDQLDEREKAVNDRANQKIAKAVALVNKVHDISSAFEKQAQKEYDQIIEDAKVERQEILAKTKTEVDHLFKQADMEISDYKANRYKEVEKNLVKLVMAVTQKVVDKTLNEHDHRDLIYSSLDEVVQKKNHDTWKYMLWAIPLVN